MNEIGGKPVGGAVGELAALLDDGDRLAASGDPRGAVTFYQAALRIGQASGAPDAATLERLRAAQSFLQQRMEDFQEDLDRALDGIEGEDAIARTRLTHAMDLLKGQREIVPQQPSVLYYPYLAQRQFFEREEFDWVPELEAAAPAIRDELTALIDSDADFRPYVEDAPNRPAHDFHGLTNNRDWSALYLWRDARPVEANAARCPRTMAALDRVPLSHIGTRTPQVLFSRLEPGAHIPPHGGMLNCRLICHLPLIVPDGCWLRVGNETREWEEGKLLIFDDSIEHEARNPSGELRVILLFDIWRPELSEAERRGISSIFHAIDQYQALPDA